MLLAVLFSFGFSIWLSVLIRADTHPPTIIISYYEMAENQQHKHHGFVANLSNNKKNSTQCEFVERNDVCVLLLVR